MRPDFRPYLVRLLITTLLGFSFVALFNETSYLLQREKSDRAPKVVQLVIPAGTAEKVTAGERQVSLPENMTFVVGDQLEVINQDSVDHQLGPLWVPPASTARLVLNQPNRFDYSCSFTPSRYLGIDVRQATTLQTRLAGLMIAAPATVAFLFLYSLLIFPLQPRRNGSAMRPQA